MDDHSAEYYELKEEIKLLRKKVEVWLNNIERRLDSIESKLNSRKKIPTLSD